MKSKSKSFILVLAAVLVLVWGANESLQAGLKGGRGGNRGGGAGRANPSRPSRPSARPSRPSTPKMGGNRSRPSMPSTRPSIGRPSVSKPSVKRPSVSRPSPGRPTARPAGLPSRGGLKPSRPSGQRPSINRGSSRPSPGNQVSSKLSDRKPGGFARPSFPSLGGNQRRPSGDLASKRPNLGNARPGGDGRPKLGNRPADRPGIARPGSGPGGRPSAGDLGDFLGMDKPLRPGGGEGGFRDRIANRPDSDGGIRDRIGDRGGDGNSIRDRIANRPGNGEGNSLRDRIANRPDGGEGLRDRIANRPGGGEGMKDRIGDRIGGGDGGSLRDRIANRPGGGEGIRDRVSDRLGRGDLNVGDINVGNNVINNRPTWANLDRNRINNINNRWGNQIGGLHGWNNRYPGRTAYWRGWADGVRSHGYNHFNGCFSYGWWNRHPHGLCGWHYGYSFGRYPSSYWWTIPTFATCTSFFTWSAPAQVWSQPIYYDYGQGGNVVYQDNSVYIDGTEVATAEEFAQSAATLATVAPPEDESQLDEMEWMALGTFAVTKDPKDVDAIDAVQLAVNKQGVISGTLFNSETDEALTVQGQVDPETQRVAFRVGEIESLVVETGLYNLTQDEAPVLVHFGTDDVENWLLVRMENKGDE